MASSGNMFTPGNVFGCSINAHRQGWDGSVCKDAANWDCGSGKDFRENYCAAGDNRCFVIHAFDEHMPRMSVDIHSASWLLDPDGRVLEDQILLLWGKRFKEPRGVTGPQPEFVLFGAYRVERVFKERINYYGKEAWVIKPYEDGWVRFPTGAVKVPAFYHLDGQHFKGVADSRVRRVFEEIAADLDRGIHRDLTAEDIKRFRHFHAQLDTWLDVARDCAQKYFGADAESEPAGAASPFAALRKIIPVKAVEVPETRPAAKTESGAAPQKVENAQPAAEKAAAPAERNGQDEAPAAGQAIGSLPEAPACASIESIYGKSVLRALKVAFRTKNMVILSGSPGTGKSRLATRLIEDAERERTLIVPVASTWRGREDLLGYVNPVNAEFEPTAFTQFLMDAEAAWDKGDRRPRLVLFEEFNLSQPEHWFSDVLVRCEYPADNRADRTLDLGGQKVRGMEGRAPRVYIPPTVYFIATINSDHTVRALSPRVIDRSSLVEVRSSVRDALKRARVTLDEAQMLAIEQLGMTLEHKSIGFSIRSALSLQKCMDMKDELEMTEWEAIDYVLMQEVLSKVRLLAGDPSDEQTIEKLQEWCGQDYCQGLRQCAGRIGGWSGMLSAGRDVIQA